MEDANAGEEEHEEEQEEENYEPEHEETVAVDVDGGSASKGNYDGTHETMMKLMSVAGPPATDTAPQSVSSYLESYTREHGPLQLDEGQCQKLKSLMDRNYGQHSQATRDAVMRKIIKSQRDSEREGQSPEKGLLVKRSFSIFESDQREEKDGKKRAGRPEKWTDAIAVC